MRVNVIHARADRQVSKDVISACLVKDDHRLLPLKTPFLLKTKSLQNISDNISYPYVVALRDLETFCCSTKSPRTSTHSSSRTSLRFDMLIPVIMLMQRMVMIVMSEDNINIIKVHVTVMIMKTNDSDAGWDRSWLLCSDNLLCSLLALTILHQARCATGNCVRVTNMEWFCGRYK